ncbi:glycosyltransferase family 4 protein [PVC group bacterium]|nr:glycosyltransferase family 4 protein [PVC group bacterium]
MKIAIWHNLHSGGAKRALHAQVAGLLERGCDLECWTNVSSCRSYLPLDKLIPVHVVNYPAPWSMADRLMPRFFDLYQKLYCNTGLLTSMAKKAADEINNGGFDVLLAANCRYQAAPPIGRFVKTKTVLYAQEPYRAFYEEGTGMPLLMNRKTRIREEKKNAQAFDCILANSKYSQSRLQSIYETDVAVNYLGIDTDVFKCSDEPRESFILGAGSIQPHKRVDLAIRSVAQLPEPRLPLVWIGNLRSGGYARSLKKLAKQLNVKLQLKVMVTDDELISYLSRAYLFLYTSRLEPFGLTPLEANACETPVVAVAEGGVKETIENGVNGFVTNAEADEIAAAMSKIIGDSSLRKQMGKQARKTVTEKWSQKQSIDELEKKLRALR